MMASCRKTDTLATGGIVTFSVDTLMFDTVFTAQASFTNGFKIYNPQNEKVVISSVRMKNGSSSYFHLNVDGHSGNNITNVTIQPHDSVYVFATVNIDPKNDSTPFVVEDDFIAKMNGKDYSLHFLAYGQDAHYIVDSILDGTNITWENDKPYVIIHSAEVNDNSTLTIKPGCRIYMHQDSWLLVKGKLVVSGNSADTVVFQGDRLDRFYYGYEGYPGEWGGIYFSPYSKGSKLSYTRLLNCGNSANIGPPSGIYVAIDSVHDASNPQLSIDHSIIQNSLGYGILSLGGTIRANNCLINTTGAWALAAVQGGDYIFENCTFAIFGNDKISHEDNGTVALFNYFDTSQTSWASGAMNAVLTNCIVWGGLDTELYCNNRSTVANLPVGYNVTLNNCLIKGGAPPLQHAGTIINNCIFNQDPLFTDYTHFNYHLSSGSPAIDAGITPLLSNDMIDLDGKPRLVKGNYDIGCYEFQ
jgi:hypothetical protein